MSKRYLSTIAILALGAALGGCGNDDFLGQDLGESIGLQDPTKGLVDAHGNIISRIDIGDPVTIQVPRLTSNTAYLIRITDSNDVEYNPPDGVLATSDRNGVIRAATVVQNLDSSANNALLVAPPGDYKLRLYRAASGALVETIGFTVRDESRVYCSDSGGARRASFRASENVFVTVERGAGELADGNYDVHVLPDLGAVALDGSGLPDATGTVTVSGGTGIANLGLFAAGAFDIVVDVDGDGLFNSASDLVSRHRRLHACFTVQGANTGNAIVTQVAADRAGNHRQVFDPLSVQAEPVADVFSRVTSPESSNVVETLGVAHYVVAHQAVWNDGDPLTDVTQSLEIAPVQDLSLSASPWLLWPQAAQTGGCYDLVVDVNRNGSFDAGIDFVDNIDHNGTSSCGLRVADVSCVGNIQITNQETVFSTTDTAIALNADILGSPSAATITISSGVQSNVLALPTAPTLSTTVPLFNGVNYITLAYVYAGEQTCARSMIVTQGIDFNALFRVQLVWDGDTDMDLHLVRPGGLYQNGGGGTGDCNYANCNVGLSGTGSNSIDWGNTGDDDDPKLDVDCIACGTGIENIWMSQINETGAYTVFVDAFSGIETDVRVRVYIGGALVNEVECGAMSAGSATDSCRAGVINWNGSTGVFTPDGATATTF